MSIVPAPTPNPEDLLSIPMIAAQYGIPIGTARGWSWRMTPAAQIPYGPGRSIRLFRRADIDAYLAKPSTQNRRAAQHRRHQPRN